MLTPEEIQKLDSAGLGQANVNTTQTKSLSERLGIGAVQQPNYVTRVAQYYTKAGQDIISGIEEGTGQIQKGMETGGLAGVPKVLQGIKTAALRTVGGVAGATFAPITEAPVIKPAIEAIGTGISKIPGVNTLVEKATELSIKHPESAKDLQNIVDIAVLLGGMKTEKPLGAKLEKTGIALEKSGVKSADITKNKFAQDLVKPIETAAVKLEQVKRTTESGAFFKKDIVAPTKLEAESAKQVALIPGISKSNTFQKNFNIVRDYNVGQAKKLESDIIKNDFIIPKQETIAKLNSMAKTLSKESPLITGDAEITAQKLINGAKKFVQANEGKGSGLLKARKEYDSWVLTQKPKAFDAKSENAFTIANNAIRSELNTILDEKVINVEVKKSLQRQSSLYRAMDNIAPKAAQEANAPLLRTLDNVGKVLGTKSKIVQGIAATVGIGGLGAAATFAPTVAVLGGVGLVVYKAGKLIMKPEVRIVIGKLLQTSGRLLNSVDVKILQDALDIYK